MEFHGIPINGWGISTSHCGLHLQKIGNPSDVKDYQNWRNCATISNSFHKNPAKLLGDYS